MATPPKTYPPGSPKLRPSKSFRLERRGVGVMAAVEVTVSDGKVTERDLWQPDLPSVTAAKLEGHMMREVGL